MTFALVAYAAIAGLVFAIVALAQLDRPWRRALSNGAAGLILAAIWPITLVIAFTYQNQLAKAHGGNPPPRGFRRGLSSRTGMPLSKAADGQASILRGGGIVPADEATKRRKRPFRPSIVKQWE
jgi:hypothetical protein